jgi:hypothetical protein
MGRTSISGLIILLLITTTALSCAKPPTAEIDAAVAAVAKAEANPDAVEYANVSINRAKEALSRMQTELAAKNYEAVKAISQEVIQAAEKAISDGAAAKARARDEATALITSLRSLLAEAEQALAAARAVKGIVFDDAAAERDIRQAAGNIASAGTDLTAGNFRAVMTKGQAARSVLGSVQQRIAVAVQAASRKK